MSEKIFDNIIVAKTMPFSMCVLVTTLLTFTPPNFKINALFIGTEEGLVEFRAGDS